MERPADKLSGNNPTAPLRRRERVKRLLLAVSALALASRAAAHDFWIEPSTFHPNAGERVTATLRVGQKLDGEPVPRIPPLIRRFVLKGERGEMTVVGPPGGDPAGYARVPDASLYWLGYESNAYPVTLDAQKFEHYLKEEGLEQIIGRRAKAKQSTAEGREHFYRCAKALLARESDKGFDAPIGFTLELIPRKNPYAMRAGGELPLLLEFRGKPIANVLVVAMNKNDPGKAVRARTDAKGRVTLRLGRSGFWLIKAVHMEAAPPDSGADWESWWASMTFDLAQ